MAIPKKVRKVEEGIWQLEDSRWLLDIQPGGRGSKRLRVIKDTKTDAKKTKREAFALFQISNSLRTKRDSRKLADIIAAWFKCHGNHLITGSQRLGQLNFTCEQLGNPVASKIDPKMFLEYRDKRLESGTSINHLNHELTYLKSAFNELIKIDDWKSENPFGKIKKLRMVDRELVFLSLNEIQKFLKELDSSLNKDVKMIAEICLSIGCRWGEAQNLRGEQIHNGAIHLHKTKNGGNRTIPICKELEDKIFTGRLKRGKLFGNAWDACKNGLKRAEIHLPRGQKTHVLRHTYASHFMIAGGNLLELNKILGHKTIQMTMNYAHLAPEHLSSAITFGPLERLKGKATTGVNQVSTTLENND